MLTGPLTATAIGERHVWKAPASLSQAVGAVLLIAAEWPRAAVTDQTMLFIALPHRTPVCHHQDSARAANARKAELREGA